jgi:ribonuclease HI
MRCGVLVTTLAVGRAFAAPTKRVWACQAQSMGEPRSKKRRFYAVVSGRRQGVYDSWADCEKHVKGFAGNRYKGFSSEDEARGFLKANGVDIGPHVTIGDDHAGAEPPVPQKKGEERTELVRAAPKALCPAKARLEFDGASKKNPGPSGFGAVIFDDETGNVVEEITGYLGDAHTNNQAEYAGLIAGLHACVDIGIKDVLVKGDSKLVINQINGDWQVKNETLRLYYRAAKKLVERFDSFRAEHVYRNENTHADRLSNVAIEEKKHWSLDTFDE